jgi:23S rRNA (guanine745-N1)-methyltransferase
MAVATPRVLICPVCSTPLRDARSHLVCVEGHTFNRAREGYVDLLPMGHGRSRLRGDTREMLDARRRILTGGHFARIAQRLGALAREHCTATTRGRDFTVLDAGCGIGYYVGQMSQDWPETRPASFFGVDISRAALRMAARAYPRVSFILNDVKHRLCFAAGSVDLLLNIFAPRNATEFRRVLSPRGRLLSVIPQPTHLQELRAHWPMLRIDEDKADRIAAQLGPAAATERLEYHVSLDGRDQLDLLRMTPSYWHLDTADLQGSAPAASPVTISVAIAQWDAARL